MRHVAYWKDGFINVPKELQGFVGGHKQPMNVYRTVGDKDPIEKTINRHAVDDPLCPRIAAGRRLARWYQQHFSQEDSVIAVIRDPHTIIIEGKAG